MNWLLGLVIAVGLVLPIGAGLGLGAYRAAQSPTFYAEAGALLLKAIMPVLVAFIGKPNSPEVEAKMHTVTRRAGEWDNFHKREREH